MEIKERLSYVWDYDIDRTQFREILEGRRSLGRLNQDWAARLRRVVISNIVFLMTWIISSMMTIGLVCGWKELSRH